MHPPRSLASYQDWYQNSLFWSHQLAAAEEAAEMSEPLFDGALKGAYDLFSTRSTFRAKVTPTVIPQGWHKEGAVDSDVWI